MTNYGCFVTGENIVFFIDVDRVVSRLFFTVLYNVLAFVDFDGVVFRLFFTVDVSKRFRVPLNIKSIFVDLDGVVSKFFSTVDASKSLRVVFNKAFSLFL